MRKLLFTSAISGLAGLSAQAQPILTETGLFKDFTTDSAYIADRAAARGAILQLLADSFR